MLATALASLSPLLDLRAGRPVDVGLHQTGAHSEVVGERTIAVLGIVGVCLIALASLLALLAPSLTIAAGVALALASICLIPAGFWVLARLLPRAGERIHSSALIVAMTELRATTTRSVALAGIVCLAVYGGIAIGGARRDLLAGIERATDQYFATAQVWVTSGKDVFNTNSFRAGRPGGGDRAGAGCGVCAGLPRRPARRGRAAHVGAGQAGGSTKTLLESSQLVHGEYARATRLIRGGGWAAVSSEFASERHLHVGSHFALPTPTGSARLGVAAITTNSGWPAGAITLTAADYAQLWHTSDAAALEVSLKPGVSPAAGRQRGAGGARRRPRGTNSAAPQARPGSACRRARPKNERRRARQARVRACARSKRSRRC